MTWLQSIGLLFKNAVNKFFTAVLADIKGTEPLINDAAVLTYKIYNYVEDPNSTVLAIEAVIPAEWTAEAKQIATANILPIAQQFTALGPCIQNAKDANEAIVCMATFLKNTTPEIFAFITHGFASLMASKISGLPLASIFAVIESIWKAITQPAIALPAPVANTP